MSVKQRQQSDDKNKGKEKNSAQTVANVAENMYICTIHSNTYTLLYIIYYNEMRHSLLSLLCLLVSWGTCNALLGQEADSTFHTLRVIVDGISKTEGTLVVGVVDQAHYEKNDMKGFNQKVPVTSQTMELTFDSLQAGEYAIIALVKEDNNDPSIHPMEEQSGFSQNVKRPWKIRLDPDGKAHLSKPTFDQVKFLIPQKRTMHIVLGNPSKSVELIKE